MSVHTDIALDEQQVRSGSPYRRRVVAYLDIETASQPEWLAKQAIGAGVEVGPETRLWLLRNAGMGALSPWTGQITCWAIATDADEVIYSAVSADELGLLQRLADRLDAIRPTQIVAHGGHQFDFPFLRLRALALRMPALAKGFYQAKPWDGKLVDTSGPDWVPRPAHTRTGWDFSLDSLAELFGIVRPPQLRGAEMPAAWFEGRADNVRLHCEDDVRTLKLIHPRLAEARS